MFRGIIKELRRHMLFTAFGAATGIIIMLIFYNVSSRTSYSLFYIFHPAHVLLSALVTASMYKLHKEKTEFWKMILIGYIGSVGIATLSDSIIPYIGEFLLCLPHREVHIGFIEKWWLVNPLAFAGIAIAYLKPTTKFPHSGHVLLSTWASLFHIIMASGTKPDTISFIVIFLFLFLAVWIPCCLSDIVFPLLFVKKGKGAGNCI